MQRKTIGSGGASRLEEVGLTAHVMRDVREQMPAVGERIDGAAREHRESDEQRRL
jgi:hypothetical protein